MIRTYRSGRVVEKSKFLVGDNTRPRKKRTKGATKARKQDANDRDAIKRLARVINCNFSHGDLWVTLRYDDELLRRLKGEAGEERENIERTARHQRDLFLRRVKRDMERDGLTLRRVAATSDMDGESKEDARIHHHLLLNKDAREYVLRHWPAECVDIKPLRDAPDYTSIAVYIIRQVRRQPDGKKYSCSRNLKQPIIEEAIYDYAPEIRLPKGATVVHRSEYDVDNPNEYIRYIAPTRKRKVGGHADGKDDVLPIPEGGLHGEKRHAKPRR